MKKRYLKLTGIISSSILSCGLIISPISSSASVRPRPFTHSPNSPFRPIRQSSSSSNTLNTSSPRSTPIRPLVTQFNPIYNPDSDSLPSNVPSSWGNSARSSNFMPWDNASNAGPNNNSSSTQNNPGRPSRITFTNLALGGITVMSLVGTGIGISQIIKNEQNKKDHKPDQGNTNPENLNQEQQQNP